VDDVVTTDRSDWSKVATAFRRFFDGLGDVVVDNDHARFIADDTSLELRADGSSSSFMPLHAANLRWEQVTFDPSDQSVRLTDGTSTYVYRVPPRLVEARKGSAEDS
jgi:hypothetical protein